MNIQPITEEAHNTAMLTLTAERQGLLYYRGRVVELQNIEERYNDLKIASEEMINNLEDSERAKMEVIEELDKTIEALKQEISEA